MRKCGLFIAALAIGFGIAASAQARDYLVCPVDAAGRVVPGAVCHMVSDTQSQAIVPLAQSAPLASMPQVLYYPPPQPVYLPAPVAYYDYPPAFVLSFGGHRHRHY